LSLRIEGRRVVLRSLEVRDLDLYAHWQRAGREWRRMDGPYYASPTAAQVEERVSRILRWIEAGWEPDPRRQLAIADPATDLLFGTVTRYWISRETNWPAAGIGIYDPKLWRRGLGFEALGLWTDHLFDHEPGIVRVDLRSWSGNTGLIRLAEKLGFRLEARFRKARIVDGEYYDGLGYGILEEEWRERYPDGFSADPSSARSPA
jgi:putative hydrolase of HD superfamily